MKRFLTLLFSTLLIFSAVGCNTGTDPGVPYPEAEMPNPFTEFQELSEAEQFAGFLIALPESIDGYPIQYIQAEQGNLIQVLYLDKQTEDEGAQVITIRKALGSEDISGDYTEYAHTDTLLLDDLIITTKGDGEHVSVATWTSGDYSYSITTDEPMPTETISEWIGAIQ